MPFSYKTGLVKTDWAFVISTNWSICHLELGKLMLEKSLYPRNLIDQQLKQYLCAQFSDKRHKKSISSTSYYKLLYIGNLLTEIKPKMIKHYKLSFCCLKLEIDLVLENKCLSI